MDWLLAAPNHWTWFIVGALLLILEVFAPGVVFLWLAIAAGAVGLLVLMAPDLSWQIQLLLFAALSIAAGFGARRYFRGRPPSSDRPALNRRGHQYIGQSFTLSEPIVNGRGRMGVEDTQWRVEGPDLPAGTTVRVVGIDGTILRVERESVPGPSNKA